MRHDLPACLDLFGQGEGGRPSSIRNRAGQAGAGALVGLIGAARGWNAAVLAEAAAGPGGAGEDRLADLACVDVDRPAARRQAS